MPNAYPLLLRVVVVVDRAEAEAESILEQETLLGIPLTDNLTALSTLRETLEPMARLWTTAKEYLDGHHSWLESPLRTVNAEEAERKVNRRISSMRIDVG